MCRMQVILIHCFFLAVAYGLEFLPTPSDPPNSLINYNTSDGKSSLHYRNELDTFLDFYRRPYTEGSYIIACEFGVPPEEGSKSVCAVDIKSTSSMCSDSYEYSYKSSTGGPCIFLKLSNKMVEWVPEYYNSSTVPEDMPQFLKKFILDVEHTYGVDSNRLKVIWVSCNGENPADEENIGPIAFYPVLGFAGQYFPIRDEDHYINPFVALHFEKPQRGVVINIQCKAWARNLHDEFVHFQLLVDS